MGYKEKVDAGADFGVTQLFYDTNLYFEFLKKSHAIGVPKSFDVFPGIMPIQSYAGFRRMTGLCKTFVPKHIDEALELIKDNENAVKVRHRSRRRLSARSSASWTRP